MTGAGRGGRGGSGGEPGAPTLDELERRLATLSKEMMLFFESKPFTDGLNVREAADLKLRAQSSVRALEGILRTVRARLLNPGRQE
jgi:hypothetical protein